jgi:lipoprotein NlpI
MSDMTRFAIAFAALMLVLPTAACSQPAPKTPIPCDPSDKADSAANIASCTRALQRPGLTDDYRATLLTIRGNNHDGLKQYDAAMADYGEAIRLRPDAYGYANRGLEYCRKGDCKDALADYDKAVKLDPGNTFARYGRGVARLRSGDTAGGNADIAKANADDPDVEALYREIGMTPP